jgi:lysozyme
MTTPLLIADLKRDEGCRLAAYQDTLGIWTLGYGHTAGVRQGDAWSQAEADETLIEDVAGACARLDKAAPWWRGLSPVRQDVIAEMAFNLGVAGLMEFRAMLAAARGGDYAAAAVHMLASRWAQEVGARARRLAAMMAGGARP